MLSVDFEMSPDFEDEISGQVLVAMQAAVDATSRAHREQGIPDVEERLRSELAGRGVDITDDEWLSDMGEQIRSSDAVILVDPDEIGVDGPQ